MKPEKRDFTRSESIIFASSIIGFGVCFGALWLLHELVVTGPGTPDAAHGLIVEYNNHGVMHYISATLSWGIAIAFWSAAACALTLFGVTGWRDWTSPGS